jgi:hypothetical protein
VTSLSATPARPTNIVRSDAPYGRAGEFRIGVGVSTRALRLSVDVELSGSVTGEWLERPAARDAPLAAFG